MPRRLKAKYMRDKRLISSNSEVQIFHAVTGSGREVVVKESKNAFLLRREAKMLKYLAAFIRVPEVYILEDERIVMEYIPNDQHCGPGCEEEIADALAQLHGHSADLYGFAYDTTIGPFRQSNRAHRRWIDFYREERVFDFCRKAHEEGAIDARMRRRIEGLTEAFERYLHEPEAPSLLHGDVWGGNVLTHRGHFAALIDPAIYYGHAEMELAFIGMFNTFGEAFYDRYRQSRVIADGFFEERAHLYRIFPYLVHIRAFGSMYIDGLEGILKRFGH